MANEYELPSRFGVTGTKAIELFTQAGAVLTYADGEPIETEEKAEEINAQVWSDLISGLDDPSENDLIQVARNPAISPTAVQARDNFLALESAAVMEMDAADPDFDLTERAVFSMDMDDDEPLPGDEAVIDDMSMDDDLPTPTTGPSL